jgi:hypothetical protein
MSNYIGVILSMCNTGLGNYVIPGLESHLIGGSNRGIVRLFHCTRNHQEQITPHSHRFDFSALVLRGQVTNHLWGEIKGGDDYTKTEITYSGKPGNYENEHFVKVSKMGVIQTYTYDANEWYGMKADEIHTIQFSRDALVLFFEGPEVAKSSVILQPNVKGKTVNTFRTQDWMFQKNYPSQ